jgi:putative membrane-bound dehydrogenase-like protein
MDRPTKLPMIVSPRPVAFNGGRRLLAMPRRALLILGILTTLHGAVGGLPCGSQATADELPAFPRVPPTEPAEAEKSFEVLHGFRMELIAAEPHVASPVDLAYDEDGRAYVVEMRDYPYPEEKNALPTEFPGTVRLVVDDNGDGRFDRSTIFADGLAWPTSVACWKGGVFVAAAPDIWYFKDTDGDGRADIRRKVFTGFGRYNVQAIMNNLRWGLDNRLYGAAAGNGGTVRHADRPGDPPVSLARRDFVIDPVSEKLEATSGGERFGNAFDDWGNRFVCNIRNPVQHVALEQRYLARNPLLVVPRTIHDCAESGDQLRVFRLSPPEPWRLFRAQRWAVEGAALPRSELIGAGFWTSSSGVTIYRGGAYPPKFRGNAFIGEVAGNLVHRQVLTRDGVTFRSERADAGTEFIRSRDNWFRPVNFVNAPDGTLHVVDMYRETIEHPWSIPDDIKSQLDLSSGKERGRIYRLAPPRFVVPKPPKLSTATTAELIQHLASPHIWWRETAQRLLVERQDRSAAGPLRELAVQRDNPLARLHALYTLAGLGSLSADDLTLGFPDDSEAHAEVVRHAIVLAERWHPELLDSATLQGLAKHPAVPVRLQTAFALGSVPEAAANQPWQLLAASDSDDPWMRAALLSADRDWSDVARIDKDEFSNLTQAKQRGRCELARQCALLAGLSRDDAQARQLLTNLQTAAAELPDELTFAYLSGLGEGLSRRKASLNELVREGPAAEWVKEYSQAAAKAATDDSAPTERRIAALELVSVFGWSEARPAIVASLAPTTPRELQRIALGLAGRFPDAEVAEELVRRWKQFPPPLRDEAVGTLLARATWHASLVTALEQGVVPAGQIAIPHRARLAALPDKQLAERAQKALAAVALGPRSEVVKRYQRSLALDADAARGQAVYRRECANCHKHGEEGFDVGPSLATIQHRSPQEILIHVLDPNREVSPSFLEFTVRLTDGRILSGLIASETDAGITLRRAENREESLLRSEIEEIAASGKSLMPEGLEQKISEQEMADLIALLKAEPRVLRE